MGVTKTNKEILNILTAGEILSKLKDELRSMVVEGAPTSDLELKAHAFLNTLADRGLPVGFSFLGYGVNGKRFPAALCVCVNDEVVHGIPGPDKVFKQGDLVSVDIGISYDGYHADSAFSCIVGGIDTPLVAATRRALYAGISAAVPGNRISNISYSIQRSVELDGFFVIRQFSGHSIGKKLHEKPAVLNYGSPGRGIVLVPGMVFAIEPIIAERRCELQLDDNGIVYRTKDNVLTAHFEETVVITTDKPIIATRAV